MDWSIPCPGNFGTRLGCTSVETPEMGEMPGHRIGVLRLFGRLPLKVGYWSFSI